MMMKLKLFLQCFLQFCSVSCLSTQSFFDEGQGTMRVLKIIRVTFFGVIMYSENTSRINNNEMFLYIYASLTELIVVE